MPSKANPVDIGRIKAKTCARAGKFKSVQQNEMMQQSQMRQQNGMKQQRQMRQPNVASPSMMPLQGQNEYMPASVGMFPVPIMGPHVAALSAANPGLIPGMFPGVLPGAAVPIAVPVVAGQQWQLLPNGAFQQMGATDATGLGGATLFPMATPMAMAPAGFQFGTPYGHPSMMAALQQQQQQQQAAYFFNSGMMAAPPDLGDDENLDTTNAEDDDDSTHLPLENGMGVVVGSNQMMNNIQMVNNMQMMNNSNNQKPFASSDADDDGKGSDAFYDG